MCLLQAITDCLFFTYFETGASQGYCELKFEAGGIPVAGAVSGPRVCWNIHHVEENRITWFFQCVIYLCKQYQINVWQASQCTWLNVFYPGVKRLLLLPFSVSIHSSIKMQCIFLNKYKFEISESKNGQNDSFCQIFTSVLVRPPVSLEINELMILVVGVPVSVHLPNRLYYNQSISAVL